MVFTVFCLEQGIYFITFYLEQGIATLPNGLNGDSMMSYVDCDC